MPPRPSPGPSWEALNETATPTTSGDEWGEGEEDEIVEETQSTRVSSVSLPQASLKRKETEHLGTVPKRPRHELEKRQDDGSSGNASKISGLGSVFSSWKMPREANKPTPSSSKSSQTLVANVNRGSPSGSRVPSSSMLPPPSPLAKLGATDQSPKRPLAVPERPKPVPKYTSSSKLASQTSEGSGFKRKEFPTTLSANLFSRTSSSQPIPSSSKRSVSSNDVSSKSQGNHRKSLSTIEIIDLCEEDSPPRTTKPKPRMSLPNTVGHMSNADGPPAPKKNTVRKSIGGQQPRKRSPKPLKQWPNEVIDISSDDDDPPPSTSKPPSKTVAEKPAVKPANAPRPQPIPLRKSQKQASGSKSASESDSMKVDRVLTSKPVLASKPPSFASATSLEARKPSTTVSAKSMDIDDTATAGPSPSITAPVPRKVSITGLTENMQLDDLPIPGPSSTVRPQIPRQAVSAKPSTGPHPSFQNMRIDDEGIKSMPAIPSLPRSDAVQRQPSSSNLSQSVPSTNPPAPPNVGSSSALTSSSKPTSTSRESNATRKFSRPQVAVKSTGIKRRPLSSSPSSSSSSSSGSDSDDEQENDDDDKEEEEEEKDAVEGKDKAEARPQKAATITEAERGGEREDNEMGKSAPSSPDHLSPRPFSEVDDRTLDQALGLDDLPSSPRTPERTIRVKEQPVSPELFPTTSRKLPVSASISRLYYKSRGDTLESPIDLTSDTEDTTIDMALLPKSPLHKPTNPSSTRKGKGRALPDPSPTPPPLSHSEPDDHFPRPSDSEHSLPPASPSPDKTPLSANPGFANSGSGSNFVEDGRKSAPLVLSQETTTDLFGSARLTGALPANPKSAPPSQGYARSLSLGSQTQASFDAAPVRDGGIRPDIRAMPPVSSTSQVPQTPGHIDGVTTSARSTSPRSIAQPNSPLPISAASATFKGPTTSKSIPNVPSNPDSDVEMQPWETDDDAMEEAEEVQALVEQTDEEIYEVTEEPRAASTSPEFDDLMGGDRSPSRERRYSYRSSRSSASEAVRIPSDDEDVHDESRFPSRNTTPEEGQVSVPPHGKTLGGFPAITWKEYRQNLDNFTPKCYYAKDLPHTLQDQINNMSERTRKMPEIRTVFEAMIEENTIENEPNAPRIELFNDIDDEPTPPWEFHYTNEMWHGEGVPPPDIKNLTSCNCKGACNPKSKTCACLKRQREALTDPHAEFMYDKTGRLRVGVGGVPVNECNDLCGCGDECRNRVVQHGRKVQIFIQKTEHKGWGIFAGAKKIPRGTFIGIYSGELLTDAEAHDRGVNYNKFGRTYLFDLDFHHLRGTGPDKDGWSSKFTVDAYHAGNFTRFLNHSCDPNCMLQPLYINEGNLEKPLLVIFSDRDIEAHEEICFSYSGDPEENDEEANDEPKSTSDEPKSTSDEPTSTPSQVDKIYARCMCGASNCKGRMFK